MKIIYNIKNTKNSCLQVILKIIEFENTMNSTLDNGYKIFKIITLKRLCYIKVNEFNKI